MTPTIKLFREGFTEFLDKIWERGHIPEYANDVKTAIKSRFLSEIQKAREEVLEEIEKWAEEKRMKNDPPQMILTGFNLALTDLQHHISKMRDNKTDV